MGSTAFFSTSASTPDALVPAASIFSLSIAPRSSVSMLGVFSATTVRPFAPQSGRVRGSKFPFSFSLSSVNPCLRYLTLFVCFSNPRQTQSVSARSRKTPRPFLAPRRLHFLYSCPGFVARANHSARVTSRVRLQTGARSCGRAAEWGGVHCDGQMCGGLAGLRAGWLGWMDDVDVVGCEKGVCVCVNH
jgi:hypothetical protein